MVFNVHVSLFAVSAEKSKKCYFWIENNFHTDCRAHYTALSCKNEHEYVFVLAASGRASVFVSM